MKRFFMILGAVALTMSLTLVSCKKDNGEQNGTIIDDNGGGNGGGAEASLKGSSYVPFILDEETAKSISGKIAADLRPDDVNKFLYVWDNTYEGSPASGLNFYGEAGYTSMAVASAGWSGAGFFAKKEADPSKKLSGKGWTFHIAYKGPANIAQFLTVISNNEGGVETVAAKICLGQGSYDEFNSNGQFVKTHTPLAPVGGSFIADEWNEYEVDLTGVEFFPAGLPEGGANLLTFSSGGVQGTPIKLDAAFLYKK